MSPPCEVPVIEERVLTVGVRFGAYSLGGMGVVALAPDRWSLTMLSPMGPELFVASAEGVTTPFPEWSPWLARMPFHRDLLLAFVPGECSVPTGRLRGERRRRWRGVGGPARADVEPGKVRLWDPWRRYELTFVWDPDAP
jgi:hypothetical protein